MQENPLEPHKDKRNSRVNTQDWAHVTLNLNKATGGDSVNRKKTDKTAVYKGHD